MRTIAVLLLALVVTACASRGVEELPMSSVPVGWKQRGYASWYGPKFHGRRTASGEVFNMFSLTAAHRTLPLGTYVRVTNLKNGRSVVVKINDRGPFVKGRIIDLSYAAARRLGMIRDGVVPVEITVLGTPQDYYSPVAAFHFGYYYIQVGSFRDWRNAIRRAKRFKKRRYPVEIRPVDVDGERFYRVLIGPYTRTGATRILYSLRRRGIDARLYRD